MGRIYIRESKKLEEWCQKIVQLQQLTKRPLPKEVSEKINDLFLQFSIGSLRGQEHNESYDLSACLRDIMPPSQEVLEQIYQREMNPEKYLDYLQGAASVGPWLEREQIIASVFKTRPLEEWYVDGNGFRDKLLKGIEETADGRRRPFSYKYSYYKDSAWTPKQKLPTGWGYKTPSSIVQRGYAFLNDKLRQKSALEKLFEEDTVETERGVMTDTARASQQVTTTINTIGELHFKTGILPEVSTTNALYDTLSKKREGLYYLQSLYFFLEVPIPSAIILNAQRNHIDMAIEKLNSIQEEKKGFSRSIAQEVRWEVERCIREGLVFEQMTKMPMPEKYIQELYYALGKKRLATEFSSVYEMTGKGPELDVVKKLYEEYRINKQYAAMQELSKETGIPPPTDAFADIWRKESGQPIGNNINFRMF